MLRKRQRLITFILLILLLCTAAVLSLRAWLPDLVRLYARIHQVQLMPFSLSQASLNQLTIPVLTARYRNQSITGHTITLRWQWPDLLKGRFSQVSIAQLDAVLQPLPGSTDTPDRGRTPSRDPEQYWQAITGMQINIQQFRVRSAQGELTGSANATDDQLNISAHISAEPSSAAVSELFPLQLQFHYSRKQSASLTLFRKKDLLGQIRITPAQQNWLLNAAMDLNALPASLLPVGNEYALAFFAGHLSISQDPQLTGSLGLRVENKQLTIHSVQQLDSDLNQVNLMPGSYWQVSPVLPANLQLHNPVTLTQTNTWQLAPPGAAGPEYTIAANQLNTDSFSAGFRLGSLKLSADKDSSRIHSQLQLNELSAGIPGNTLSGNLILDSYLDTDKQQIRASHQLKLDTLPVTVTGKFSSTTGLSGFDYRWQLTPVEVAELLNASRSLNLARHWAALELDSGTLYHSGQLHWHTGEWQLSHQQRIENLSGNWNRNTFDNLTLTSQSQASQYSPWQDRGQIHIQNLDIGIEMQRSEVDYRLTPRHRQFLTADRARTELLAGRLELIQALQLDQQLNGSALVKLERLSLAQLVALQQNPEVSATGYIYGQLPVTLSAGKPSVQNGELEAAQGRLNYRPLVPPTTQPQMRSALAALENFYFAPLQAWLSYQSDGETRIRARLQGYNPDWQNGRAVDFTLTLEDNLNQLLRALRYSDSVNQRIEQHYQGR